MCMPVLRLATFAGCIAAVVGAGDQKVLLTVPGLGDLLGLPSKVNGSVAFFKGVPYAQPPTGDLRWSSPRPYGPWKSRRDATSFGNECFQIYNYTDASKSEDCLFLNIATPLLAMRASTQAKRLPVLAFIHGGAYSSGSANNIAIDSFVAAANLSVIVVSIEYRLNVFGFLGSSALRGRSASGSTGNYGIEDQRLALTWIRDHIEAFGGDSRQITLFGESAGGNSVLQHLTQPASFGLYDKGIIESGTYNGTRGFDVAQSQYEQLLSLTNCSDVTCLQRRPAYQLLEAANSSLPYGPVVDDVSLLDFPFNLLADGLYNREVPVILGSNRDEAAYFVEGVLPSNMTDDQLDSWILLSLPCLDASARQRLREIYSPTNYTYPRNLGKYSQAWWAAMSIITDGGCTPDSTLGPCAVRRVARWLVQGGTQSVFTFFFAHPSQKITRDMNLQWRIPFTGPGNVLVAHTMEMPYVFNFLPELSAADGEVELSLAMQSYWSYFAASKFRQIPGLPDWSSFSSSSENVMRFEAGAGGIKPQTHLRQDACDFWDAYAPSTVPEPASWVLVSLAALATVVCFCLAIFACDRVLSCKQSTAPSEDSDSATSPLASSPESEGA
eukprot:TRINITY_DN72764_c0_g1_i1.p1 TRINITY_DN72764_c0_g1~~TRINITY_DN72764_c0_g1_i1.p1  ORF type:complete len:611 (-),score=62.64 TRINITY_DN72764_c0_g1_i1:176-2008(-)